MTHLNPSLRSNALAALGVLSLATCQTVSAALVIDVGTHQLVPNSLTPQFIDLFVDNSGGSVRVGSFELWLQVGDGLGVTPYIDSAELVTGTLFAGNGLADPDSDPAQQRAVYSVSKATGGPGPTIPAGSRTKIASIGIITSGYSGGTLAFDIWGFDEGFTSFYSDDGLFEPIPAERTNGFLNVAVPETGHWAALTGAGLLVFGIWRRRSR